MEDDNKKLKKLYIYIGIAWKGGGRCAQNSIKKRRKKMCNTRNSRKEGYFVEGGISLGGSKEMFGCQHLTTILFLIRCDYNSEHIVSLFSSGRNS